MTKWGSTVRKHDPERGRKQYRYLLITDTPKPVRKHDPERGRKLGETFTSGDHAGCKET